MPESTQRTCPVCEKNSVNVVPVGRRLIIEDHQVKIGNKWFECLGSGKNFNDYPR